ncbi:MAG: ABC-2 family transporter protein [Syntrophaceae bacterium PtaB.Bin095]|nr:MAG: ABC-2 family transporter protein [Syntrophaceae bacterium PtaB.Bin095]
MVRLVWFETIKTFTRLRTYIGFLAFGILVPLVVAGLKMGGQRAFERNLLAILEQDFIIGGNVLNGWFFGFFFLGALWVHVPIVLTLVAGDQIAGEGDAGTFRFLLTRAGSRSRIITAKFIVTLLYTAAMVLFIGVLTLGLSLAVFGSGDLLVVKRGLVVLPESGLPAHFLLAWGLAILSMFVVSSLCFLFSAFTDNSVGPIVATMAVIIISLIIITLPFEMFQAIRPWLFVNYFDTWQKVFDDPIPWGDILRNVWILLGFTALFFSITLAWFNRKDILS